MNRRTFLGLVAAFPAALRVKPAEALATQKSDLAPPDEPEAAHAYRPWCGALREEEQWTTDPTWACVLDLVPGDGSYSLAYSVIGTAACRVTWDGQTISEWDDRGKLTIYTHEGFVIDGDGEKSVGIWMRSPNCHAVSVNRAVVLCVPAEDYGSFDTTHPWLAAD